MAEPDRQEKAMSINHDLTTRLARDHQRQMLAEASNHMRHQQRRPVPQTPRTATRIIRGLAAAITSARVVAARVPGAVWPARLHVHDQPSAASRLPVHQPTRPSDTRAVALAIRAAPDWRVSHGLHVIPGTTRRAVRAPEDPDAVSDRAATVRGEGGGGPQGATPAKEET